MRRVILSSDRALRDGKRIYKRERNIKKKNRECVTSSTSCLTHLSEKGTDQLLHHSVGHSISSLVNCTCTQLLNNCTCIQLLHNCSCTQLLHNCRPLLLLLHYPAVVQNRIEGACKKNAQIVKKMTNSGVKGEIILNLASPETTGLVYLIARN